MGDLHSNYGSRFQVVGALRRIITDMPLLALLLLLAQAKSPDRDLQGLAARCGSEIPWTRSLEEAAAKARESGRPVCWYVPTLRGSRMDRTLVLRNYMRAGPFMMPGVVALLRDHFVPLELEGSVEHRRRFGLVPLDVVEPCLVFLAPDLSVLHRTDRLTTFSEAWMDSLLRAVLAKAGRPAPPPLPPLGDARRAIAEGRPDPDLFLTLPGDENLYWRGVALHLTAHDEAGRAEWRKIRDGRWAWKAAAELARDGPFVRGFEVHETPPEAGLAASSTRPAAAADVPRALRFLRGMQRQSGVWDDSQYNFGGDDSLPNVWIAVTALAALALREWGGEESRPAVLRAESYLRDESRVAVLDKDEIAWAYAYRVLYFARAGKPDECARLAAVLLRLQEESGTWAHEYSNPFMTATALHALAEARKAGVEVPAAALKRGLDALAASRDARGVFSYGSPGRGGAIEGGAGRMPFLEFVLASAGRVPAEGVKRALAASFRFHPLLERVRKVDDHADAHQNGGFFFWYDQWGRSIAAAWAGDRDALDRQRRIVLETPEFDGTWVDSHELGRVYGTAVALLTLKATE
jgi:hypothetical protein